MRSLNFGAMALVLAACGGSDAVDCEANPTDPSCPVDCVANPTDPRCGAESTTPTAPPGPTCDEAARWSYGMDYFWDDTAAATRTGVINGYDQPSLFYIEFGESSWQGDPNQVICSVFWDMDGLSKSQAALDLPAANGFTVNPGAPLIDTCQEEIAAGNVCGDFFSGQYGQSVLSAPYSYIVTADLPASDIDSLIAAYFEEGKYWNSVMSSDMFGSGDVDGFSYGWTVDADFSVVDPANSSDIERVSMQTANGQTNGFYVLTDLSIFYF